MTSNAVIGNAVISRILVRKYIGQSALLFLSCGSTLFAFAWVSVWVVSLLDMGQFQTMLEPLREYEKFAPISFDALLTYVGRIGMTYDHPIVILCTVIWCVSRGSDVVSGELGRGTLEMILSQPITRKALLLSHATVSIVGLALLCMCIWAGIGAGVYTTSVEESIERPSFRIPIFNVDVPLTTDSPKTQTISLRDRVDVRTFASPTFHLFSFGFFLLGLATLFSSLDRYRWRTVGTVVAIYVAQLVMFGLGTAARSLEWLLSISFFSCYKPQKMASMVASDGLAAPWSLTSIPSECALPALAYPAILLGLGMVFYIAATIIFTKRDLPAPL